LLLMEYFWDNVCEVLVHQTKIGEVFFQEDDSTLLDDGSNDIIRSHVVKWLSDVLRSRCPGFKTSAWRT
jgi:hypothetical protein